MSKTNIFRESKETLAEKLYDMLDDRGCFGDMFLKDEFVECMTFTYEELLELEKMGYIMGGNSKLALHKIKDYLRK